MTLAVFIGLLLAIAVVTVGLQVVSRQLQRFPVDGRPPGPLIDTSRRSTFTNRPADLDRLHAVVSESRTSASVAAAKLNPLLADLRAAAPPPSADVTDRGPSPTPSTSRARPGRRGPDALAQQLDDLERRWGLAPGDGADT